MQLCSAGRQADEMKAVVELRNTGDSPIIEVVLALSWPAGPADAPQLRSQALAATVRRGETLSLDVDFGGDALAGHELLALVKRANGGILTQRSLVLPRVDDSTLPLAFAADADIDPDTTPPPAAPPARPAFAYGRLLDKRGVRSMDGVQVIVSATRQGRTEPEVLAAVLTEAQGYFSIDYPDGVFTAAMAQVGLDLVQNPMPIRLEPDDGAPVDGDGTRLVFPRHLVLVAEFAAEPSTPPSDAGSSHPDCDCKATEFGDKRVLEEFSFFSLVRTSEPAIQGFVLADEDEITLEEVLRKLPFSVFELLEPIRSLPLIARPSPLALVRSATPASIAAPAPDPDAAFRQALKSVTLSKSAVTDFLRTERTLTKDNVARLFAYNEAAAFGRALTIKTAPGPRPLGRVVLGAGAAVDWDDQPTLYQAVEVAHGHLLHFKSEWIADGYSLGDLLYSLPLAPGQKKQIVVFDWERRESAVNEQSVDLNESLQSSLGRDRDILEIARGTVNESMRGSSRATTGGASAGVGGVLGGILFGVSGGFGTSSSRASQDSFRQVSSTDSQKLRDRIVQSANSVRSLRSTVIQTVSQGERFEVSSESVANYNHCHALTIQYYEVLRHFKVRQRFADAREVLFVPLLMTAFDARKAVRWRDPLRAALLQPALAPAFDATDRVLHEWENSGFPSGAFASESLVTASGALDIRFVLQRPLDDIVEVDDLDRAPVFAGGAGLPPIWHKKKVGRIIPAHWEKLKPFLEGVSPEEFHRDHLENATDKDGVFHRLLGEKIARAFIASLVFAVADANGNAVGTLPVDASVTSRYARNGRLRVTLRLSQPTSFARDRFHYLQIRTRVSGGVNVGDVLPDGSFMTIETASMRYRTAHFDGYLFRYQSLGDDLSATDGVSLYAGPSSDELKDPRKEDIALVNRLIAHLNDHLEHYHKALWLAMTPERRFLLLDGIILDGKGEGRSVASLVENDLLAVVGNSLVFPVAPGLNLNPDFGLEQSLTDFYSTASPDPVSVAVPTKGVFAEAAMGRCNACEKIDDSRFWRWEESPIPDSPTAIAPINTDTRRAEPGNLQPQTLPNPIVAFQNAPAAPDPTGLAATLGLLGQSGLFKDITGLEGNQRNAAAALQGTLEAAKSFGQEAAKLEVQKTMERRLDKTLSAINGDASLSPEKKAALKEKALSAYMGAGPTQDEPKKDPNNARFQEGVQMIDALQKAGALEPSEAAELKKKLQNTLLDNSSSGKAKSLSDDQSLIESVSKSGVSYVNQKPNGERTEIRGQPDGLRISLPGTVMARTFHPERFDISGETEVSVTVANAPADAVFEWNAVDASRVTILSPAAATTRLRAGKPGITTLGFKVYNADKSSVLQLLSMKVGVPQFFVIRESTIDYPTSDGGRNLTNGSRFDTVLAQLGLGAEKNFILTEVRDLVNHGLCHDDHGALSGYNLRAIWQLGPFNEKIPPHLINPLGKANPDVFDVLYSTVLLAGYPKADGPALFGETVPPPGEFNGPGTPNEVIRIFPGLIEMHRLALTHPAGTCAEMVSLSDHLQRIVQAYLADPTAFELRQLMLAVLTRMIANTILHEVYHSVLDTARDAAGHVTEPDLDAEGHTLASATVKRDILATCRDLVDRTAVRLLRPTDFPAAGSFTIDPFSQVLGLNLKNDQRVARNFALPPTPPFGS
jgi:hypothetical protein